jgi:hypothetical protein
MSAPGRPAAVPHRPHPPAPADLARWLALRLYRGHRAEPVRVLEALAAVAAARAAARPPAGTPDVARLPAHDPAARLCLRVARRALAGAQPPELAGATRWHRASADPPWARGRVPCAEFGDYLFYRDNDGEEGA